MTVEYAYEAPDYTTNGGGVNVELRDARRNMLWIAVAAFYSATHARGYLIPGASFTVNGTLPEFTSMVATWSGTDTFVARCTPTWTSGAITSVVFEMDLGVGFEDMAGPNGDIPAYPVAPTDYPDEPDPKGQKVQEGLDRFRESLLVLLQSSCVQNVEDKADTLDWFLPGYTTSVQNDADRISITFTDAGGAGDDPTIYNHIEQNQELGRPALYNLQFQRESALQVYDSYKHSYTYDGNGRLQAIDVVAGSP